MNLREAKVIIRHLDNPKFTNEEKVTAIYLISNAQHEKEVYITTTKLELLDCLRWLLEHPAKVWSK